MCKMKLYLPVSNADKSIHSFLVQNTCTKAISVSGLWELIKALLHSLVLFDTVLPFTLARNGGRNVRNSPKSNSNSKKHMYDFCKHK